MPTNNRRVAAYLPDSIDEKLIEFKIRHGLASEDKPQSNDSKALILILQEFFGVNQEVAYSVNYYATLEQFDSLQKRVDELYDLLQKAESRMKGAVSEAKSELKSELESKLPRHSGQLDLLTSDEAEGKDIDSVSSGGFLSSLPSVLLSGLSAVKLAERLKCNRKMLGKRRENPDFTDFCREKDPDGVGWEYRAKDKKYYPTGS